MQKKSLFLILLILGTAFWGLSFPITKLAVGNLSPSIFLLYRFSLATVVLAIIFSKSVAKTTSEDIKIGMALAIPLVGGINLQTLGLKYSSASQCSFLAGMCVVIVPVLKTVLHKKVLALKVWLAAALAMVGLFVISIKEGLTVSIGDLYTIAGSVSFAFYLINVEKQTSGERSILPTIVPMFATCTLITFILSLLDHTAVWWPENNVFWMGIVYCALFSTAFMYTVSNLSQRFIASEKVAVIYLFEPVFAAISAMLILNESLSWRLLIGGSFIFAATIISELKFRKSTTL